MKFSTWLVFSIVWVTIVYFPLAHMVWGGGFLSGWTGGLSAKIFGLNADGAQRRWYPMDFAGGTVVHIDAGIAGIVLAFLIGKRKGYGRDPMRPHNVPFVMLGAGLLWFGWFGFNAGSGRPPDGLAGLAWMNTSTATERGHARLAGRGEVLARQGDRPRRRIRCGGRSGRHHPGRRIRLARRGDRSSVCSPARSVPGRSV